MNKDRNALRAGIFIVVSLVLILGVIFSIRGFDQILQTTRQVTVLFRLADDISGLREGDEVRIGGYTVGTIDSIELVPDEPDAHLAVKITVPDRFTIRRDAEVRIQSTFTGVSVLNFQSLGTGEALGDGDVLIGRPGMLTELSGYLSDTGPRFRQILANVEQATSDVRQNTVPLTNQTLEKIGLLADAARAQINPEDSATIGHSARGMMTEIRDLIGDTKGDFRTTASNVAAVAVAINQKIPELLDQVDALLKRVNETVATANAALVDIRDTANNARELTAAARSVVVSNRSRFDDMIASMKVTADNLKGASAEIRRSPWRLLYRPSKGEMANLNLFDTARAFAEGADDLATATTALRDALQDPDIPEDRLKEFMQRVEHSFSRFEAVEKKLWDEVRE